MSLIYEMAGSIQKTMSADFEREVEAAYAQAEEATNGCLVNKAGRARGVRGIDLFTGSEKDAYRYASDELIAHWMQEPRLTKTAFERQWLSVRGGLATFVAQTQEEEGRE